MIKIAIKKTILIAAILFISHLYLVSANSQISDIEEKLQQQEKAKVIVVLKPEEEKVPFIFGKQQATEDVLATLNLEEKRILGIFKQKQDFHLKQKYSTVEAFAGEITPSGLRKLKNNPNIQGIYLDKNFYIMLSESAPLINANDVWKKKINNTNLTGKGQTVCIIDTGIDYKHPAIGSPQCRAAGWQIDGTPENYNLVHSPYLGYEIIAWTITKPGYSTISVHFSKIDTDPSTFIIIQDPSGNIIQAFSGYYEDQWTLAVPGNKIKINLINLGPSTGYGFKIDKILDGFAFILWENCGDFIGGYDAVGLDTDPMDTHGHGTHVAGIITSNDQTYKGIAPDAKIVAVRAFNNLGIGLGSDILGGIDACIRYADIFNISIISLSLASVCDAGYCHNDYCDASSAYTPFINKAFQNNIAVIAASGNNYDLNKIAEPACVSKAIPVGSIEDGSGGTIADRVSSFSNRWNLPMIFAPGDLIRSTHLNNGFASMKGTSMSTPHISGVVALIYQYAKLKGITLTPQQIENTLIESGKQIYDTATGRYYKRVDALAAIRYLEGEKTTNIPLAKGWNLVSSPLNLTNITETFNLIQPYFVSMFSYDAENKEFIEINPFNNNQIDLRYGVWLKVSADINADIVGKEFGTTSIPLAGEWNLIGRPSLNETHINESDLKNHIIFAYINNSWSSYVPNRNSNSLQILKPGYGYWIKQN